MKDGTTRTGSGEGGGRGDVPRIGITRTSLYLTLLCCCHKPFGIPVHKESMFREI